MQVLHHLDSCSLVTRFEIQKCEFSTLFFVFKIILDILSLLNFLNLRINLSISTKKRTEIFIETELNPWASLGLTAILTMLPSSPLNRDDFSIHNHFIVQLSFAFGLFSFSSDNAFSNEVLLSSDKDQTFFCYLEGLLPWHKNLVKFKAQNIQ